MQSTELLPALRELPADKPEQRLSYREQIHSLIANDAKMTAAEVVSAASITTGLLWSSIDIDDELHHRLQEAYERAAPVQSQNVPLHQAFADARSDGAESVDGFVSNIKGKVAELDLANRLQDQGFEVRIPNAQNYPDIDLLAIMPDGTEIPIQVKTQAAESAGNIHSLMIDNPDTLYANSSELFNRIADSNPELASQMIDIGSNSELTGEVNEGLDLLTNNMGIDVPDGVGEILPYAGAIIAGARLVYGVIRTEQQFKAIDRTNRNKVQVVQALTTMSRMGVTTVLSTVGAMGGAAAGSLIPGIGNLAGGIAGTLTGAGMGMYLNRHLQPHILSLALDITGLTDEDLFYFKNKPHIDQVAWSFRQTADDIMMHYPAFCQPTLANAAYPAIEQSVPRRQLLSGTMPSERDDQETTPATTTSRTAPNGRQCIDGKVGNRCPNTATVGYYCSEHGKS